jgi:hypothetical protein
MPTPCRPRRLGARRRHALARVLDGADVGEQEVLDTGANRPHAPVNPRLLLDLHHAAEVGEELDGAADVVQLVEIVGRVLADELDVVEHLRLAHQLDQRRPAGE